MGEYIIESSKAIAKGLDVLNIVNLKRYLTQELKYVRVIDDTE